MFASKQSNSNINNLDLEQDRWRSFGDALDDIHRRAKARMGAEDVAYVRRLDRLSRGFEIAGRALLMLGPGPLTFVAGVGLLWLYKQIQATEIGHTVLHGAFNRLEGAEAYRSADFEWKAPIDEKSWIAGHNGKHHGLTNVAGEDPDIDFGHARLTEHTPHRFRHYFQVPLTLLTFPVFTTSMNAHFTGLVDLYVRDPDQPLHFVEDRSAGSVRDAWRRFFRKARPYYAKELLFFPVLAGPRFFRVLLGNLISEALRDVYTAATIYCGHVGEDVTSYAPGTRPRSRGERYAMQVNAANNFEVPWALSVLCGGLDRQIEHHLFPALPTNRLREIAPEVRRACEAHGVQYRSDSWPRTLGRVFRHLWRLSFPLPSERSSPVPRADAPPA
jgi:linoleoyl-CoA desaturase